MNESSTRKRRYTSAVRTQGAEATRAAIVKSARFLFARRGIDKVTIAEIGAKAGVAASTVYALYKSKEGILRELMKASLFGSKYQSAQSVMAGVGDPVRLIELTAHVARAIYESESADLGLLRGSSSFSPALKKLEREFEAIRYEMQEERLRLLFARSRNRTGLGFEEARRILWTLTSRDVYRMLVHEGGWTAEQYQTWLARTLLDALVA
jgi:AcrR family transcriptional regulator